MGIGASAGGLEALEKFLAPLPRHSGAAFVVVMHLDPSHDSMLVDLLSRRTKLTVRRALHGDELHPDQVYVIPPNAYLTVERGRLHLSPLSKTHGTRLAVDHFFASLARDRGASAIAIVLSGTGSDGTMGLRAIKGAGGVVMVQAPSEAQYDGMPRSAIGSGLVDYVMPAGDIAETLGNYLAHPSPANRASTHADSDGDLVAVLEVLHQDTGHDFSSYAQVVLNQRVRHRMSLRKAPDIPSYIALLDKDEAERERLFRELEVGSTCFFRDPEAFETFADEVIGPLVRTKPNGSAIRAWIPACATGEEAYSIALLLHEAITKSGEPRHLQIFASDLSPRALQIARAGTYSIEAIDLVPERLRDRYLVQEGTQFRIAAHVREAILFARHDVLQDPPFSKLDLISCRNLLSFLEPATQSKLLARMHFALLGDGALFVGDAESMDIGQVLFRPLASDKRIARRVEGRAQEAFKLFTPSRPRTDRLRPRIDPAEPSARERLRAELLERFTPPAVLVDAAGEVLYFHGDLDPFLTIPSGTPTTSILERTRDGIRGSLRAAFQQAVKTGEPARTDPRRIVTEAGEVTVRVKIRPLQIAEKITAYLIAFDTSMPPTAPAERAQLASDDRVAELEIEIETMRNELEGTIAALQLTNEELRSSNEEISSMNEELQTSNEEITTSKEELQSLNEELVTLNGQLTTKLHEVEDLNEDLENFLASTDIATVFLDRNLDVRRYTPSTRRLFHISDREVGRPLEQVRRRFQDEPLMEAAARVQRTRRMEQAEVLSEDGRWYARRISPFLSKRSDARGVVLTFTDIDLLKRAELDGRRARDNLEAHVLARNAELSEMSDRLGAELGARGSLEHALRSERARLQSVLDTAEDAILSLSALGIIESANAAAERLFGYSSKQLIGSSWGRLVADAPPTLTPPAPNRAHSSEPIIGERADGTRFPMELSVGESNIEGQGLRHTVIIRDVSMRRTLEEQYRHAQKMEAIGRLTSGIAHDFNNLLMGLMGCSKAVLRRLDEDSPARPYAAELEHAAQRGAQLTKDLLSFTRRPGPERDEVDVAALLEDMSGILSRLVGSDITFESHASAHALYARAGRGPLQQLLLNLVTNARDAIGARGTIRVEVDAVQVTEPRTLTPFDLSPGRYVTLTVRDDGEGMLPETRERLFEPFFTTKGVGKGTGLGLSMVYSIVERSNGAIEVESERGHGAAFRVFLPAIQADATEDLLPAEAHAPATSKRTVLVVEDEMLVRQMVVDSIEEHGFEVVTASNGLEADEKWTKHAERIDVVLTDVALPGMSGPELVRRLRANRPDIPCIFMSAYPEASLRDEGRIPDDARSLQKPFDTEVLIETLEAILEG